MLIFHVFLMRKINLKKYKTTDLRKRIQDRGRSHVYCALMTFLTTVLTTKVLAVSGSTFTFLKILIRDDFGH